MAVITLTTDFGDAAYVGAMRGVLAPHATVDITHGVPPQDLRAGALALLTAVPHFPAGSVHVVVVDPGVGTDRRAVVSRAGGHLFVGPDNGVLAPIVDHLGLDGVWELAIPESASPTFHGRDVFAPAAKRLAEGAAPGSLGKPAELAADAPWPAPEVEGDEARGEVVAADSFGTLVTNVPGSAVPPGEKVRLALGDARLVLSVGRTYADVDEGELLVLVGSSGLVEVAVRNGRAEERLAAGPGSRVVLAPLEPRSS